ncbi:hypothetical protein T484DRAFT_1598978, partial [Baffinella frigidus]
RNVCDHIDEVTGVQCGFKCERSRNLETHKRYKHSDARDYKCTGCSSTFKEACNRDRHWARKHAT